MKQDNNTLLGPYRVLDLTDERGLLCGKILADMGADVIKIEPPGGDPARKIGPFYKDDPNPEKSLYWFAYNTNKRSITLDIEDKEGRQTFKDLVKTADFLIESFDPGYMDDLGLGYSDLAKINSRLILVSITPFGQTGPYVENKYKYNDMIVWALSGFMHPNGDPDRAPTQITFPQAYLHGAAEAATAAMTAHYARERFGEGQHVDVSIQQAIQTCNQMSMQLWDMYGVNSPRGMLKGSGMPRPDGTVVKVKSFFQCKDGWIFLLFGGGALKALVQSGNELMRLIDEAGMARDLADYDWSTYDAGKITQEEVDHIQKDVIEPYLKTLTKLEFYEKAIERKILACPFQDPKDIAESPQLEARNFFVDIDYPELGKTFTHCGPFIKFSETPMNEFKKAPSIGEHNNEIFNEPSLENKKPDNPGQYKIEETHIFKGLKVLDFTSGAVGPLTTKYLADHGANVVHVESRLRPDVARTAGPFKDGVSDLDHSAWQPNYHTSKYGIVLNMDLPGAKEIAWKLIEWCDVIAEGFTPGVMEKWGMDYESVKKKNPDVIYFSTCQQGQEGPHSGFRGYGNHAAAVAGMCHMMGWPDRDPAYIWGAYTDFIAPHFSGAAVIAALDFHRRTGKGQYIDLSQFEVGVTFLAPVIMDFFVNNRIQSRNGNRMPQASPHGSYECKGDDRWVAIAVTNDVEWKSFCRITGDPEWSKESRFHTHSDRKANEKTLDEHINEWTKSRLAEDVMEMMQKGGVPAAVVENAEDLAKDPQLEHRGHFKKLEHEVIGPHRYDAVPFQLSKSPQGPRWAGPVLGKDIEKVCTEFIGMSLDEISDFMVEGVFE